jgi:hypothetical protein
MGAADQWSALQRRLQMRERSLAGAMAWAFAFIEVGFWSLDFGPCCFSVALCFVPASIYMKAK